MQLENTTVLITGASEGIGRATALRLASLGCHVIAAARSVPRLTSLQREIERIRGKLDQKGLTLIPLRLYFKRGRAKVEMGLAKGKARHDKRETIRRRQAEREMQR
ncbi:MAG: SsrA-binding protein, partial [Bacteroidota bacterium]|nr:SsrA-binding protein [Bacteroidota bacterium]